MPFGGSSCTSLAQRQSDAVVHAAGISIGKKGSPACVQGWLPIEKVGASLLPMLDDFLAVVARRPHESDEQIMDRGQTCERRFDNLLEKLNLPKAPENDQTSGFSVVWFGIKYFTKTRCYGIPAKKWEALRLWVADKLMNKQRTDVPDRVDAATLRSALGKFHHKTLVWCAGRPSLYALWKLFFTARFKSGDPSKLWPKKQQLVVTTEVKKAILFRWRALLTRKPPIRRMIGCSFQGNFETLDILRVKKWPSTQRPILVRLATPACTWEKPEILMGNYGGEPGPEPPQKIAVWLETLLEGLELMIVRPSAELILVRTNIQKLAEAISKDLYVKSITGTLIAQKIHARLEQLGETHTSSTEGMQTCPLEIRCVLVQGGTPHPRD